MLRALCALLLALAPSALASYRRTCCASAGLLSQAQQSAEWQVGYGGKFYAFYDCPQTWFDASSTCRSAGGRLVSIRTQTEQAYLEDAIESRYGTRHFSVWIGLRRLSHGRDGRCGRVDNTGQHDDVYRWSDGSYLYGDYPYHMWDLDPREPQPNCDFGADVERCVQILGWEGTMVWNDAECGVRPTFCVRRMRFGAD